MKRKLILYSRKKIRFLITILVLASILYLTYAMLLYYELSSATKSKLEDDKAVVRGTHPRQRSFYEPDSNKKFTCIHSMEVIDFHNINDDYCDCLDGSDEPGTNACPNGIFFCSTQVKYQNYRKSIPSQRVNDGICDCCDGSDEWKHSYLPFSLSETVQRNLGKYIVPCPNLCNT